VGGSVGRSSLILLATRCINIPKLKTKLEECAKLVDFYGIW
jgi:hypothetical protein